MVNVMIKYIGERYRQEKGWSVPEFADKAQVARNTIYNAERNIHLPDLATLDILATTLGVEPWKLIQFKGGV